MIKKKIHVSRKNMNCIAVQLISGSYSQRRILDDAFKKSVGLSNKEFNQNLNALRALDAIEVTKDISGQEIISIKSPLYMVNLLHKEAQRRFWIPVIMSTVMSAIAIAVSIF